MIDIPLKLQFEQLFARGALFHCQNFDFYEGHSKDKFILVMSGRNESDYAHFYLPTSQIEKCRGNRVLRDSMYILPVDSISAFTQETAIIIRSVKSKARSYFEQKFTMRTGSRESLTFCETIPEMILDEIDRRIKASNDIALATKRHILPDRFFAQD